MPRIPPILAALVAVALPAVPVPGMECPAAAPCRPDPGPAPERPPAPDRPPLLDRPPLPDRRLPADVLDLENWYLTLPTGRGEDPDTVFPPDLRAFADDHFRLNHTRDGVVFRARVGGVTTENSDYPRSELREMRDGKLAGWSNTSGTHTMTVRQAITRLPEARPHVVTAQIHGGDDDVVQVRLEGEHLKAQYDDGNSQITIDPAYLLGTPYDLRITAAHGRIEIFYNGGLAAEIPRSGSGWYFKTGSYVQSNPAHGDDPNAVAEVVVYSLQVQHTE